MNGLLKIILGSQDGAAIKQLSSMFGLGSGDVLNAVKNLLPALSQGMKQNLSSSSGLGGLLGALGKGQHGQYLDQPDSLAAESSTLDGNKILGHLLGGKDASRQVASQAAASTGIDVSILKKMLPLVAGMSMGAMSKQTTSLGLSSKAEDASSSGLGGMLGNFLDADDDGSISDDLLNMAKKFF